VFGILLLKVLIALLSKEQTSTDLVLSNVHLQAGFKFLGKFSRWHSSLGSVWHMSALFTVATAACLFQQLVA
jgi:hypothetical protein